MDKNQRVVITGGNGFIGSFLANRLVVTGNKIEILSNKTGNIAPGANFHYCNILNDVEIMDEVIQKGDVVVHLACSTIPAISEKNRSTDLTENVAGSIKLLEICVKKKIKKIIFASSGGTVYGNNSKRNHKEDDVLMPLNSYGAIKVAIENYIQVFNHLYGLPFIILRISNPYGRTNLPSTKMIGAVDVFLRNAIENKEIVIWGDGKNVRDYIFIDDLIDFMMKSIEQEEMSGIYNVGTGIGVNLIDLVTIIRKITNRKIRVRYEESRAVDVKRNVLDIRKASDFDWYPKYSLEEGIKQILFR